MDGELLHATTCNLKARIERIGVIFKKTECPKILLRAIQEDVQKNTATWSSEYHFIDSDYQMLDEALRNI